MKQLNSQDEPTSFSPWHTTLPWSTDRSTVGHTRRELSLKLANDDDDDDDGLSLKIATVRFTVKESSEINAKSLGRQTSGLVSEIFLAEE